MKGDAMTTVVTPPSEDQRKITEGQITKFLGNMRAMLEKHASEFNPEALQLVLGQSELVDDQLAVLRKRVEAVSNVVIRPVKVNRNRTGQEVLTATGRRQYKDDDVVATMPKGEGNNVEVVFFNLGRSVSETDLDKEYDLRGLKPADPYSLAAVNEADPAFADNKPNCTHWKDASGKWCFATFSDWGGGRLVSVFRVVDDWGDFWWFAGLRKK